MAAHLPLPERLTTMRTLTAHRLAPLSLVTALAAGCAAGDAPAPSPGDDTAYAEGVYASYEAAAGGRIALDVTAVDSGSLQDLAGLDLADLLGVPATWIRMSPRGTEIAEIAREPRDPAEDEWRAGLDLRTFEDLGYPLAGGAYRLLTVTAEIDGAAQTHRALEACWPRAAHCIVMDPVLLQADAFSHTRARLLAEGWRPIEDIAFEPQDPELQPLAAAAGVCTLNSSPAHTKISITYPAYTIEYKNIFGMVLVRKTIGGQQAGVSCFVNGAGQCVSSGFGFSNASSCFANLGYTCDCDNTGNQVGTSADGAATQSWAETRCAHRAFLDSAVSWSREGVGSSFAIRWDTAGSEDASGGQIFDSCSLH
jgi:hypothetical protein